MPGENGKADSAPTREQLEARVEEFKRELTAGEERLRALEAEATRVRETVLRIEGALLAYGEILGNEDRLQGTGTPPAAAPVAS